MTFYIAIFRNVTLEFFYNSLSRKICKNCYCRYDDHDVKNEDELHHEIVKKIFRRERGLVEQVGKLNIFDPEKQPDIAKQVKANFIKVPEVSSPVAVSFFVLFFSFYYLARRLGRLGGALTKCKPYFLVPP